MLKRFHPAAACLALLTFAVAAPPAVLGSVSIEQEPVVVKRRTFDPARRTKEMPPLGPGISALTETVFHCGTNARYEVISRERGRPGGGCRATVRVRHVDVTLRLTITIWLPRDAGCKLKAHEEGHREIAERVYAGAEAAARAAAARMDGRRFSGEAGRCEEAVERAVGAG